MPLIKKTYKTFYLLFPRFTEIARYSIECIQVYVIDTLSRVRLGMCGHPKRKHTSGVKLHFGCGSYILDDYLNIDMNPAADVRLDLRRNLPFENQIATTAFTEHFVEHLAYPEEVDVFFQEVYRVLRENGEFLISVPDGGMAVRMVATGEEGNYTKFSRHMHAEWCETDFENLNYLFHQRNVGMSFLHFECHRFAYDFATLAKALRRAGFRSVTERPHLDGLDQECHRAESLRVLAIK